MSLAVDEVAEGNPGEMVRRLDTCRFKKNAWQWHFLLVLTHENSFEKTIQRSLKWLNIQTRPDYGKAGVVSSTEYASLKARDMERIASDLWIEDIKICAWNALKGQMSP
jgi:hypothetical protein